MIEKSLRVLKWLGIIFVSLLVIAAIALFVLSRDIAPTDVSDLIPPEPPQVALEDNAYNYFAKAEKSLIWPDNNSWLSAYLQGKEADEKAVIEVLRQNEEMLNLIEQGVTCSCYVEPQVFDSDLPYYPNISTKNKVYCVLMCKAIYENRKGRIDKSLYVYDVLLKYLDLMSRDARTTIMLLHLCRMGQGAFWQLIVLAREDGVSQSDLSKLAKSLSVFGNLNESIYNAYRGDFRNDLNIFCTGEVCTVKEMSNYLVLGGFEIPVWLEEKKVPQYCFKPNKVKFTLAAYYRELIGNTSGSYAEMNQMDYKNLCNIENWTDFLKPNSVGDLVCYACLTGSDYLSEEKYKLKCYHEAIRLIVACNLFYRKNNELPDSLNQLVPEYIDTVPLDPYNGKPFVYDKERTIVYSVGSDLTDDGGSVKMASRLRRKNEGRRPFKEEDIVFGIMGPLAVEE